MSVFVVVESEFEVRVYSSTIQDGMFNMEGEILNEIRFYTRTDV